MSGVAPIEEILEEIRQGRPVLMVDDEDRENEGDFVLAAEHATPQMINLMLREGRGLVCLALTAPRAQALGLEPMVAYNTDPNGTALPSRWTTAPLAPGSAPSTAPSPFGLAWTPPPVLATCADRGIFSPWWRARVGCCGGLATPRLRSIWRGWPGSSPRASSVR